MRPILVPVQVPAAEDRSGYARLLVSLGDRILGVYVPARSPITREQRCSTQLQVCDQMLAEQVWIRINPTSWRKPVRISPTGETEREVQVQVGE